MKETLEVKALRKELESVRIDFRIDPERTREFKITCEALGRSHDFANLIFDLADSSTAESEFSRLSTIISAIATGIQLGMDIQKQRATAGPPTEKAQK